MNTDLKKGILGSDRNINTFFKNINTFRVIFISNLYLFFERYFFVENKNTETQIYICVQKNKNTLRDIFTMTHKSLFSIPFLHSNIFLSPLHSILVIFVFFSRWWWYSYACKIYVRLLLFLQKSSILSI